MKPNWYLIHCKPRQERNAQIQLTRQGYCTFLPLIRFYKSGISAKGARVEALFPRYLFIRLEAERDNFSPIRSTIGVSTMVRFGDTFATVSDAFIIALQQKLDESGIYHSEPYVPQVGDAVMIQDGPLAGYEAVFASRRGSERAAVLLQIAGRHVEIEISGAALNPIER